VLSALPALHITVLNYLVIGTATRKYIEREPFSLPLSESDLWLSTNFFFDTWPTLSCHY